MEDDCRIRPLINLLDSSTGSSVRSEQRVKIGERLIGLLRLRDNSRKEFLSARGVEATLNALDDYDCRELSMICVQIMTELVEHGYARRIVQCNGTIILFTLISRCIAEERNLHQHGDVVKATLVLLSLIKPKDKGFCLRCQNADGVALLLRLIRENTKLKLQALNLLKLVSGNSGCAREIIANLSALLNLCTVHAGRRNTGHVRTTLQIITKAIKSSNANCAKTTHLLGTVVELIESWHNYDRKHGGRLIQIRKAFLVLLSTMTMVKQNRVKLSDTELMQKLYNVCDGMIRKNAPDQLTKILINTMHKAVPMSKPVALVPETESEFDLISDTSSLRIKSDETSELPSVAEQYPDMSVFDSYFPERDDMGDVVAPVGKSSSGSIPASTALQAARSNHSNGAINLPKLMIKRRKSTTNLPAGIGKNIQSVSLPNLVFPKADKSQNTPTVSPRVRNSQKQFPCLKCTKSKTSCDQNENFASPAEISLANNGPKGYAIDPCAHSHKIQSDIELAKHDTHTMDRYGNTKLSDVINVIPCSEVYGQMSSSPVAQVKTKLATRQRRLFRDIERYVYPDRYVNQLLFAPRKTVDEISRREPGQLWFESRFESGNLSEAYLAKDHEYDLWLDPDLYQDNHRQWFFFKFGNTSAEATYTFNILNFEKRESQFGRGMQPMIFSMREAVQGYPHWKRVGSNIIYYRNNIKNRYSKSHYSLSFDVKFKHDGDTVYMAYHYPYTYTRLRTELSNITVSNFIYHRQTMCKTILDNSVDLLTITANDDEENPLSGRDYVVISARVHPGETNSSWVMRGILKYLTSDTTRADTLRKQFIFKLVPMLNPDGCIIGNHRTNAAKLDLNRQWDVPDPNLSPSIYHLKGIMASMVNQNRAPFCFVDLHGHSIKKNSFLFGCETSSDVLALPHLMNALPMFSMMNCRFQLTRERCARTVVYQRLGVLRSYTLENTYNGCDQGSLSGMQITEVELGELGVGLLASIYSLRHQVVKGQSNVRPQEHTHNNESESGTNDDSQSDEYYIT